MTENQQPYEIKVGQHGKNCECSKCQPVKTTFCECETCQAHRAGKQESMKDRLKRFLEEAKDQDGELRCEDGSAYRGKTEWAEKQGLKAEQAVEFVRKAWATEAQKGESAKDYNRDQEGMPCDFCSHHIFGAPSYCVTCDPENSNYDGHEFEVEADDMVNHPAHYTSHPSGIEVIEITEHENFCRGNALKYILRAGKKGSEVEDLKKAVWYINREIERLESCQ